MSEDGPLESKGVVPAPFLRQATKSLILFQNEGKHEVKWDFIVT
jgi:hypothetical protein